jgi:DNA-binding transcriptional MerR regulator
MSTFRIQEFAKLAGVTVWALHHYDRLGLLSPAHRSEHGYRLYCHDDLGRRERVLALRLFGLKRRGLFCTPLRPETGNKELEQKTGTRNREQETGSRERAIRKGKQRPGRCSRSARREIPAVTR